MLDRDGAAAEEAAARSASRRQALALCADITDQAALEGVLASVEQTFGRIDVLVNNAARALKGNLEQTTPEDWLAEIAGTLNGANFTRLVLPGMVRAARARSSTSARSTASSRSAIPATAPPRRVCSTSRKRSPPNMEGRGSAPTW